MHGTPDRRAGDGAGLAGYADYDAALPAWPATAHAFCYGGTYHPDTIDELITKRRVGAIAIRRAAGKAAYAKRLNS